MNKKPTGGLKIIADYTLDNFPKIDIKLKDGECNSIEILCNILEFSSLNGLFLNFLILEISIPIPKFSIISHNYTSNTI